MLLIALVCSSMFPLLLLMSLEITMLVLCSVPLVFSGLRGFAEMLIEAQISDLTCHK